MRRWLTLAAFLLAFGPFAVVHAQGYPTPVGMVNDFAGVMSKDAVQALETELQKVRDETTAEVAVAIVPSLGERTVEEYAVGLFEEWEIGKKGKDNGVLLLVAVQERRIRIEVGYGLEPVITDGRAGRIIREKVTPLLAEGEYDKGIVLGATALAELVRTDQPPEALEDNLVRDRFEEWGWLLWPVGLFSLYAFGYMARTREIGFGGVWGAGVGAFLGLLVGGLLALAVAVIGLAALGFLLDWLLSTSYRRLHKEGKPAGFVQSWGGWRGAPGPWGGGGGGGFGGFGGGRSGGGGATGRF
ncbi:MAG: TPM domain-containing protein [Chloroflexi bacterium]|nr:TPM domain-containing protein [Chloroflexota bacterium]